MQCSDNTTATVCYTDGAGARQSLVAHYQYGPGATAGSVVLVATRYTDAAGVPVDTSAGVVAAGACPVAPPDVEWEQLCDVLANGTVVEFMRRSVTSFDASGAVIDPVAVTDFALDKVTAYAVAGTVENCQTECEPATAQGVLTAWG